MNKPLHMLLLCRLHKVPDILHVQKAPIRLRIRLTFRMICGK